MRRLLFTLVVLAASTGLGEAVGRLSMENLADSLRFRFEVENSAGPWVLQHSSDGSEWEELAFFASGEEAGDPFVVEVPRAILRQPDAPAGIFRAAMLDVDTRLLSRLLDERAKWRLAGMNSYDYQLFQFFGFVAWRGTISVVDGEVVASQTIFENIPGFVTSRPTIENLFQRIADAISNEAATIDVTWDPVLGFPSSCRIDRSLKIADDESGWDVEGMWPPGG